jgi:hypothetical protein
MAHKDYIRTTPLAADRAALLRAGMRDCQLVPFLSRRIP